MHIRFCLILSFIFVFAFTQRVQSQINIDETFKTGTIDPTVIKLGADATLSARGVDPEGDGWLRLTSAANDQRGYMYIDKNLPSFLGVLIDFEYKTWRYRVPELSGADGFVVFLFDADVPFGIGGYGGSLGYAPRTGVSLGLAGGYVGIGFDEYGNFSNPTEGRNLGPGLQPNSVTLRGPTTNEVLTTNPYLTSVWLQPNVLSTFNSIGYPNLSLTRPSDGLFYRRVKVHIIPTGSETNPKYMITVSWRTSPNGNDITLLTYETNVAPPKNLKLGFSASSAGHVNCHEIRNLVVNTPVGFSVYKTVDKSTPKIGEDVTYTVNVLNSTAAPISNLIFSDSIKLGGILNTSNFTLKSITFDNNGTVDNKAEGYVSGTAVTTGLTNPFTTKLTMQANSSVKFKVVGTIVSPDKTIEGLTLMNTASLDPSLTGVLNDDLSDNVSSAVSKVAITTPDLEIQTSVDKSCVDPTNGNTYTILVTNISNVDINKTTPTTIVVTDTIPTGFTFVTPTNGQWKFTRNGNALKCTNTAALLAGASYDPIEIKITPTSPKGTTWINTAYVSTLANIGETQKANNVSSVTIKKIPPAPILNSPIIYYQGDAATPISTGKNLIWYTATGTEGSAVAPTPSTDTPGTTSYYVSQSNGSCESTLTKVDVIVVRAEQVTACDSAVVYGQKYYNSKLITTTIKSPVTGNDSIVRTNLMIKHSTKVTVDTTVCNSYTAANNAVYTTSGKYKIIIPNSAGCDSIITLNLTVHHSSSSTIYVNACETYTAPNNAVFTTSGVYDVVIPNATGCDSTITIHLNISHASEITVDQEACDVFIAPDASSHTESGSFTVFTKNATGVCDSTIHYNLTVHHSTAYTQSVYIFRGDSYKINDKTYTTEGTYTDVLKTTHNCDSVVTTIVKYVEVPNTITPNGDGIHDVFMQNYPVKIYNRNGILLFEGENGWDGTHNGKPVMQDTYFFVIYLNSDNTTKKGYVTVVR